MKLITGKQEFTAKLQDNATVKAFQAMLPLTLDMTELNGNEKYADLPGKLPQQASNPGRIENGDIMLYGSSTIVLFYESLQTPYSYTPIGRVEDPSGLKKALGAGKATVSFLLTSDK
jgi:hypothetical protein